MRRVYFEVARVFGWNREAWDRLPEWDRRMYLDELSQHLSGRKNTNYNASNPPSGIRRRRVVQTR